MPSCDRTKQNMWITGPPQSTGALLMHFPHGYRTSINAITKWMAFGGLGLQIITLRVEAMGF